MKRHNIFLKKKILLLFLFIFLTISSLSFAYNEVQNYVIKKGDTLWDIAFKFLGDPFLWPEIWHQNTYISNPDLIYPGDTLIINASNISASGSTNSSSSNLSSSQSSSKNKLAENEFYSETKQALEKQERAYEKDNIKAQTFKTAFLYDSLFKIAIERKSYLTEEFLEKVGFLWFEKDQKGYVSPGNAFLQKKAKGDPLKRYEDEVYQQFDEVVIEPIGKHFYKVGDTVDIYHSDKMLKYNNKTANLIRKVAKGKVLYVDSNKIHAVLFKVWDVISSGDRVDICSHYSSYSVDSIVDIKNKIKGNVFYKIENSVHPYPFHTFIFNKGENDGVVIGDLFTVTPKKSSFANKPDALACAVYIGKEFSTLAVMRLFDSFDNGDTVESLKRIKMK